MKIEKIYPRGFASNAYLVTADGKTGLVIDPSGEHVVERAQTMGLTVTHVLLTHGHFDHVGGVNAFRALGARVMCGVEEEAAIGTQALLLSYADDENLHFPIDGVFFDGERKILCGLSVTCIAVPGHTAGSCVYLIKDGKTGEEALFTGDTLFLGTIGRTDLPTGDGAEMMKSLRKIAQMEKNYPVYAGHGEDTTLDEEKKNNPFLCL